MRFTDQTQVVLLTLLNENSFKAAYGQECLGETCTSMWILLYKKLFPEGWAYLCYSTVLNLSRILCMPGDVNSLIILDCLSALRQAFSSINFRRHNPHLSPAEVAGLFATPIVWPVKPVFSPYASTHDFYTQLRYNGVKYLLHRVALRCFLGGDLTAGLDCSHIMHLGDITGKNFNPRHIVEETNFINQSRKGCALFVEKWEWQFELGALGPQWWSAKDSFMACTSALAPVCTFIHTPRCLVWDPAWGDLEEIRALFT